MSKQEADRLADALRQCEDIELERAISEAADKLRQWPDGEPVAWLYEARHIDSAWKSIVTLEHPGPEGVYMRKVRPLYTAPPDQSARIAELEAALKVAGEALEAIAAIENLMDGGDWEEIEQAREIARAAIQQIKEAQR